MDILLDVSVILPIYASYNTMTQSFCYNARFPFKQKAMDFIKYRRLYRVLRDDENRMHGLTAKDPWSFHTVEEHVGNWKLWTMFISTSASRLKAERFAKSAINYKPGTKRIAVIDVSRLGNSVLYIDLTNKLVRDELIPACTHVNKWADYQREVLVVGYIPRKCILETYII